VVRQLISRPKIYLAGPEVFLPDAVEIGARKKMLCDELGFVGLYPLDNEISTTGGEKIDEQIFAANVEKMRQADAGIFNLTPFRGVNADPGTAFELGFFVALNKPVFAYTNSAEQLFDRVAKIYGAHETPEGEFCDAAGWLIENFGNSDNLMLDATLKRQGGAILRPDASRPALDHLSGFPDLGDLTGFAACLRQARRHFGG
jgi:nucleoside 2-deoxyribosyltransferase